MSKIVIQQQIFFRLTTKVVACGASSDSDGDPDALSLVFDVVFFKLLFVFGLIIFAMALSIRFLRFCRIFLAVIQDFLKGKV